MDLNGVFTAAMVLLMLAVPLCLTSIVVALLRIAAGGGLARSGAYPPPGVMARADAVAARIRAHYRARHELRPVVLRPTMVRAASPSTAAGVLPTRAAAGRRPPRAGTPTTPPTAWLGRPGEEAPEPGIS